LGSRGSRVLRLKTGEEELNLPGNDDYSVSWELVGM
jgi:hypothetical protein